MAARRTRGEGSIYQRGDGRWVGVVDMGWVAGKRVRKTVTAATLKELRPKFKALKQTLDDGVMPDDATVEQWMNSWMERHVDGKLRPVTAAGYRRYVDKWIIPHLGKRRLSKLRPDHIDALYAAMKEAGKADATRRQVHAILRRSLVIAERERRISWNPAAKVEPPAVGKGSHGKFTLPEAKAILKSLTEENAARWSCALLAGLRQGEALGLRWEDVDFDRNVLIIRRAVQQVPKLGLQVVDLKSESSYRAVPMVDPVRAALLACRRHSGFVFGAGEKPKAPRIDYSEWKAALEKAGVPHRPLHAARATTASLLMEAGVSEKLIAEILGHSQVIITRKHYLHGDDRMHGDAMGALGRLLEDEPPLSAPPATLTP